MISLSCCPQRPLERERPDPPRSSRPPDSYTTSRDTTATKLVGVTVGGGAQVLIGFHSTSIGDLHVRRARAHACQNVTVNGSWADNTVQSGIAPVPYTAAVKLTTSNVGRSAADPLVPSGWK